MLWAVSRGGQASAPFASKKGSLTVVYATQLIYTCTTPIRYNHAYTHYTRQPKVPHALTGGGRHHLGALHPKDNKRQDVNPFNKPVPCGSVVEHSKCTAPDASDVTDATTIDDSMHIKLKHIEHRRQR